MKKRVLSMVLAALLCCSVFSGCNDKKEETVTKTDEKAFTYWLEMPTGSATFVSNIGEISLYKEMEKLTGVKVTFIHPPTGQAAEKFNLMMASKEFPDAIEYNWAKYQGGATKAVSDNVLFPLNDIMDKHAPNLAAIMKEYPEVAKEATTMNGEYYGFHAINLNQSFVYGGLIVRKDWLDDLGMEPPETIEEWETMLRAFKEKKGAIAPLSLQAGHFITASGCPHFTTAYNIAEGYFVNEDGKVCYGPYEDVYKDYLTTMNRWYKEGLLDKEFATINGSAANSRMLEGQSGSTYAFIGGGMGPLLNAWKARGDDKNDLIAVQYPVLNKGDIPNHLPKFSYASTPIVGITTKAKNPEVIASWFDYFYTEEGIRLACNGVEGETYNMVDDKIEFTDFVANNPDGLSIKEVLAQYARPYTTPGFTPKSSIDSEDISSYPYQSQKDALKLWSTYAENAKQYQLPNLEYSVEAGEERANLHLEINSYAEEMIMRFIMGDEPLENFEKYQATLKKMGIEKLLKIQQDAYDQYSKK